MSNKLVVYVIPFYNKDCCNNCNDILEDRYYHNFIGRHGGRISDQQKCINLCKDCMDYIACKYKNFDGGIIWKYKGKNYAYECGDVSN